MADISLGRLAEEAAQLRDAIHIAIVSVVASERLAPGQHIGLTGDIETVGPSKAPIGIVDPFLAGPVFKGDRFWMCLYPNTITSLRHVWAHPAFGEKGDANLSGTSAQWIEVFAAELGKTYKALMNDADHWVDSGGDYIMDNSESYKDADYTKWPTFWMHYELVTGRKVDDHDGTIYCCSC